MIYRMCIWSTDMDAMRLFIKIKAKSKYEHHCIFTRMGLYLLGLFSTCSRLLHLNVTTHGVFEAT